MNGIIAQLTELAFAIRAAPLLAGAGISAALVAAAASPSRQLNAKWVIAPAILFSPILVVAPTPTTWVVQAASVLLFGAIAEFAGNRERYQHISPAGLRLMVGASFTPALWLALPAIVAVSPALSPWRSNRPEIIGFLLVLWAPLLMFVGAALYLFWMFDFSVYRLSSIGLVDFRFQAPSFSRLAPILLPLIVVAFFTVLTPTARRCGLAGISAAIGGTALLAASGTPVSTQLALTSGAAFAFAAASWRPGLMTTLAILATASSVQLAG